MNLSQNLKILRKRKKFTQETVSHALKIKRSTYNGYENNVALPNFQTLINLSDFFNVSIDVLLKTNLSKFSDSQLSQIEMGSDVYIKGTNIRILTQTIDNDNEENVELVNLKAKAGYSSGFADPEYIRVLPTFQLPFLSKNKKYRAFQISGDSMEPIPHGSYIIGEFVQNWYSLKDGQASIILTLDDGIVFKCIENKLKQSKKLGLYSLNKNYEPYNIDSTDIREIWKFVHYISDQMPEQLDPDIEVHKELANLKKEVLDIKAKLE